MAQARQVGNKFNKGLELKMKMKRAALKRSRFRKARERRKHRGGGESKVYDGGEMEGAGAGKERQMQRLREESTLKTWLGPKKRGCTTTRVMWDRFEISCSQLTNYEDIATYPSCNLIIRVIYDPVRVFRRHCVPGLLNKSIA
jgi:hypothetical protein